MLNGNTLSAHDRFAATLLRMPHLMLRLLRLLLPPEVLAVMRPGGLRLCSELLIDDQLRKKHADALYRIPLRGGRQIYLYVMFEHKSWQDPLTALQLLTYMISLMHHLRREGQRLAVVIPIVIYHGHTPWSTAVTLRQLVDAPEPLRAFLPDNQVIVLDLPRADERLFAGPLEYTARLRALIAGQLKAQLPQQLQQIFTMIARSREEKSSHKALIQDILNYLSEVARPEQAGDLLAATLAGLQMESEDTMKSALDVWREKWRQEAIQEGLQEGWQEGRQEGLLEGLLEGETNGLVLQVRSVQRALRIPQSTEEQLRMLDIDELRQLAWSLYDRLP